LKLKGKYFLFYHHSSIHLLFCYIKFVFLPLPS
jgi:hypothetical protein